MVLIDRKGVIRAQHTGEEPFFGDGQAENIRKEAETLLAESGSKPSKASAKKK
jgi:hypothetical protein